jgi:hypothetical protein
MHGNSRASGAGRRSWAIWWGFGLLVGLMLDCWGCGYSIISPPARFGLLEMSASPGKGRLELGASAGLHVIPGALDSPSHLQASASYGLTQKLAVQLDVTHVRVGEIVFPPNVGSQNFGAGRLGLGFSPRTTRQWLRLTAGFGLGSGRAGTFFAPDVGFNVAWDNPYLVPFFNFSLWASAPVESSSIYVRAGEPDRETTLSEDVNGYLDLVGDDAYVELPTRGVVGRSVSLGVAIRLANHRANRAVNWSAGESASGPALLLAMQVHWAGNSDAGAEGYGIGVGVRHRF